MTHWIRFEHDGRVHFGQLKGSTILVCEGDMFMAPMQTDETVTLDEVRVLTPTVPSKMPALWNNYRALADEKGLEYPETPLYLFKATSSFLATGEAIMHPASVTEDVFYEGELGIVIGQTVKEASLDEAEQAIFGYTCINDVTAFSLLKEYAGFDQWTRSKGFDTFGVFGPVVATGLDYRDLEIVTRVYGEEKQRYPASDMMMSPMETVSRLSENMTLCPGDVICCGTSVGLGPMPRGCTVEVEIEGIGCLRNEYR